MIRKSLSIVALVALVAGLAPAVGRAQGTTTQSAPSSSKQAPPAPVTPVNLNSASQAELEKLPGVGPAMAARIIEYRQKSGGFKKIEDLMNVKGIAEKSFLKLKPLVVVTPPKVGDR